MIVTEVETDSEAARKGIRPGDIITEVNRQTVRTPGQFKTAISEGNAQRGIIIHFTSRGTSKFEILHDPPKK